MTVPVEVVKGKIYLLRGQKVLLDADLAEMYGVETKRLNEQVRRNATRFPDDFMFQLDEQEAAGLRSQFATIKSGRGTHRKYLPYAFTEQGIAMLSSVLHSDRAVQVNIAIMRAFVQMRELAASNRELAGALLELERRVGTHDSAIRRLFEAIGTLLEPAKPKGRKIGFQPEE